ncbi:Hypp6448 [Branchiostoma lanceolatum]|uniref:Hypp6448 protein n=1 Tax=Branchiostoma lanceolatum TaxID=7740 RepID=A0A8K0E4B9_BRALA|nr:Hypp6448 [Branchiostoma lanceolatum]
MPRTENSADGQNDDRKRELGNSSTDGGASTEGLPLSKEELKTEEVCTSNDFIGHSAREHSRRKTVLFNYVPRHHSPGKSTEDARCLLLRPKEEPANVFKVLASTSSAGESTVITECSQHGVDPERSEAERSVEKSSDSDQKRFKNGGKELDMLGVSTGVHKEPRCGFPLDALSLLADVGVSLQKIPRGCHDNRPCFVSDDTGVIETFVKTTEKGRDQHRDGISSKRGISKTIPATGVSHSTQNAIQNTTEYKDSKGYYQRPQQLAMLSTPSKAPYPTFLAQYQQRQSNKKQVEGTSAKRKGLCSPKSTTTGKKLKTTTLTMKAGRTTTNSGAQNVADKACPVLSVESPVPNDGAVENRPLTTTERHRMVLIMYAPQGRSGVSTVATQEQDENVQID